MLASAAAHFRQQQKYAAAAVQAARRAWNLRNPGSAVPAIVLLANYAATDGVASVGDMLTEQGIDVRPDAPVNTQAVADSTMPFLDSATSLLNLEAMAISAVADAARVSAGVGITTRRGVGWTRMVNVPCCPRCAILAGKFFRWNTGFQRHPRCMCRHIPTTEDVAGDVRTDPQALFRDGHVHGATVAEQKAIGQGADAGQVINTRRSLYVDDAGRRLTREGTTRRGGRGINGFRPAPEQIYREADGDRDESLRLLARFGYLS